jgi:hypothetical protein
MGGATGELRALAAGVTSTAAQIPTTTARVTSITANFPSTPLATGAVQSGTVLDLLIKAGNLRLGKVENRQAFFLEQPRLSLQNR